MQNIYDYLLPFTIDAILGQTLFLLREAFQEAVVRLSWLFRNVGYNPTSKPASAGVAGFIPDSWNLDLPKRVTRFFCQ